MQLLELTPEEIAFLTLPAAASAATEERAARLARRLAATLSARLRLRIETVAQAAASTAGGEAPVWQPDDALATLWLTRRLGGRQAAGSASRVPDSLIRTLDAVLAECWLDAPAQPALPPALAWRIHGDGVQAALALQLPHHPHDMTRWAREIIRHG